MNKILLITLLIPFPASAAETEYTLIIKDQQFKPNQITILTGEKIKLEIDNQDNEPVEFESAEISREVLVAGHGKTSIFVGPLDPGSYRFLNDFNHHMEGTIVVRPKPVKSY